MLKTKHEKAIAASLGGTAAAGASAGIAYGVESGGGTSSEKSEQLTLDAPKPRLAPSKEEVNTIATNDWNKKRGKTSYGNDQYTLEEYDKQPAGCSFKFFPDLESFVLNQKLNLVLEKGHLGCVDLNVWYKQEPDKTDKQFLMAKIEGIFIKGNDGVIITTIIAPESSNIGRPQAIYLKTDLKYGKPKGEDKESWYIYQGKGWYSDINYSKKHKNIVLSEKWGKDKKVLELDVSKLCQWRPKDADQCPTMQTTDNSSIQHHSYQSNWEWKKENGTWKPSDSLLNGHTIKIKTIDNKEESIYVWTDGSTPPGHSTINYSLDEKGWKLLSVSDREWKTLEAILPKFKP